MKTRKSFFGNDRLDTEDNIYYLRLNMDNKYLVLCDGKSIIIKKGKKHYSASINHVFDFDDSLSLEQLELLNDKKEVVGFRVLPWCIYIKSGDRLVLDYDIVAKFNDGKFSLRVG